MAVIWGVRIMSLLSDERIADFVYVAKCEIQIVQPVCPVMILRLPLPLRLFFHASWLSVEKPSGYFHHCDEATRWTLFITVAIQDHWVANS